MVRDEVEFIDKNFRISAFDCSHLSDLSVQRYGEDLECAYDISTTDDTQREVVPFQVLQKYREAEVQGFKHTVMKSLNNFFCGRFSHQKPSLIKT